MEKKTLQLKCAVIDKVMIEKSKEQFVEINYIAGTYEQKIRKNCYE